MATITTRSGKGSPLTNNEVDANFTNLNSDKIELTNLSVTAASASGGGSLSYANSTGVFTFTPPDLTSYLTDLSGSDTDDLSEGATNLYFTSERVDDRVNALLQAGSGIALTYDDANNELTIDSDHIEYDATNNTGSTISKGTPVYQTGASGNTITIAPADANGSGTMPAIGLTSEDITNGSTGKVTFLGIVSGFDTSSFSAGDTLYISETAGALTATRPVASGSSVQNFARVISSHASNGSVVVMGAGRSNDVPNLANKYVFIGNGTDAYEKRQLTSDDATEGSTNLFYTDARARAAISVTDSGGDGSLGYNSSTGVITYTGPSASEVRAHFSGGTGVTITSGSIAIGQAVGTTDNVTFGNVSVSGNLTVNGTTTTVNSTTVTIDDPIFTLGGDTAPASDDNKDRGIEFRWHNGSAAKVGFFGYDDSASALTFIPDATNSSEVFSGTAGDVVFGNATVTGITLGGTAITATGAEINYVDGVTSNIQTQLDAKQASDAQLTDIAGLTPTDSGFIVGDGSNFVLETGATVRASLGLTIGTHVLAYDSNLQSFVTAFTLPTSDGTSGQALTTNGSGTLAFSDVDALPSQTGNNGYFLTTDGTSASWAEVDALPTQTGNSGYYLTTDGTNASWDNLLDDPTFTGTVTVNSTEGLTLPAGTTAQRPTGATGMVRYNSTNGKVEFYNGSAWSNINIDNAYTRTNATATSSQTTFTVTYTVGYIDVYLNGVKLIAGTDFTATNGTSVVLASGAASGDLFEAIAWNAASIQQNAYTKYSYTATAAQTTFAATYTAGFVNVYLNGVLLLDSTEYTATNGTSVVLAAGAASGDSVVIEAFATFSASDALKITNNLSDLNNAATARTNLGLGTIATAATSDYAATANNLSDLASAATALTNLGLTATAAEINALDGITSTVSELNILDGVTSTAAELNYLDITTLGTTEASKAVTADANGVVTFDNGISEEYTAVTSTSNATTVNLQDGTNFSHTLTENTTFTFSNPAASGKSSSFTLKLVQDASASGYTVTWPAAVDWPAATAPTLTATASAVDYFVFITHDGGTTWYGFTAGQALG